MRCPRAARRYDGASPRPADAAPTGLPPRLRRLLRLARCMPLAVIVAGLRAAAPRPGGAAPASAACLECHEDRTLTMKRAGRVVSLCVDPAVLANRPTPRWSASTATRVSTPRACRTSGRSPGRLRLLPRGRRPQARFHPRLALAPAPAGADTACAACHGTHAVAAVKSPEAPFARSARPTPAAGATSGERASLRPRPTAARLAAGAAEAPGLPRLPPPAGRPDRDRPGPRSSSSSPRSPCASRATCRKPAVGDRTLLGTRFVSSFEQSVHGAALRRGASPEAANCVDCHGSHEMNQASVAGSRVNKARLARDLRAVPPGPGRRIRVQHPRGRPPERQPRLAGLHRLPRRARDSRAHRSRLPGVRAQRRPGGLRLVPRLAPPDPEVRPGERLVPDVRGQLSRARRPRRRGDGGELRELPQRARDQGAGRSRPRASTSANLVATCGQCHPGANRRFTIGRVHTSPQQRDASPILYWIANLYVLLIVLVIGGMTLHNLADFGAQAAAQARPAEGRTAAGAGAAPALPAHDRAPAPAARRARDQLHPARA